MSQAAEPARSPATMKREAAALAEVEGRRFRSLTKWLLMRRTLTPIALGLCAVALIGGAAMPPGYVPLSMPIVVLLLALSFILFALLVQRHIFAMRFESGPLLLDLPRKLPTALFLILIFSPAFLFATANHLRLRITADASVARAEQVVMLVLNPAYVVVQDGVPVATSAPAAPPAEAAEDPAQPPGETISAEERQRLLDAALPQHAQNLVKWRELFSQRRTEFNAAVTDVYRRLGWPEQDLAEVVQSAGILFATYESALRNIPLPTLESPYAQDPYLDQQPCYQQPTLCNLLERFFFISGASATLGFAPDPTQAPQYSIYLNDVGTQSILPLMVSGFVGLLFVLALAFCGAVLLRVLRLSVSSMPYLLAAIGAFASIYLMFWIVVFRSFYDVGDVFYFEEAFFGFAAMVLPLISIGTVVLGLIRPLRGDGWGGLIGRVFAINAPAAVLIFAVGPAYLTYESARYYQQQYTQLTALAVAAPVFLLVMWLVWMIFDRSIIRGNCAPKRFA